ncbi:thioredoxin family protein [Bacillus timonensis]|nr:thioredoxin family protein [Bacillus timonensis]
MRFKDEGFEILSVSVDIQGGTFVKPYTLGTSFNTLVDAENSLSNYFGFSIVPNGIFIDGTGTIRLIKQGFHVTNEDHTIAVEDLIKGKVESVKLDDVYYEILTSPSSLELELSTTKYKLAMEYLKQNRKVEALSELDEALSLNPDNFLIRKQRWYIRHPEKFSPQIDIEWQKAQLKREREEECGPEGCEIPGTN